jgi:hypothetical protein
LAIVVLVLWLATAVAGFTLLRAGGAARRATQSAAPAMQTVPAHALAGTRIAAVPMTPDGGPPPSPHVRVATPDGEHPLLEFSHPALAVTGIACWMMFTFVHYQPLAWIAFSILLVTLLLGLAWVARNLQAVSRGASGAWPFPPRLALVHGLIGASSLVLSVLTAIVASHA